MEGLMDIGNLSKLLAESKEANEFRSGEQFAQKPTATVPTVIKRSQPGDVAAATPSINEKKKNAHSDDIWAEDEIPTEDALLNVRDDRPTPRFEISYKQSIGTEDTFLGLSDKTPLTTDCTHIVIKIHFPGSSMRELDLDVSSNRIMAASRTHRLFTYLPADVDDANGKAAFDSKKEVLTVTLPIIARELGT
ncbi:hypothetical protein EON65_06950 [archaeon]|nr:MAG: hypothetical protein EON65_06950 [archaeon]